MKTDLQKISEMLQQALQAKNQKSEAEMRARLMETVGADLVTSLTPFLKELAGSRESMLEDFKQAMQELNIEIPPAHITIPEIKVPAFKIPEFPKIPAPQITYRAPDIKIPEFPQEMKIEGWVNFMGYDKGLLSNPLPVQIRDADGKPVSLPGLFTALANVMGGRGGGGSMGSAKTDFFTLKGIMDPSGNLYSSTNPIPVTIASGGTATSASALVDSSGVQYSGSNPLPVAISSGAGATSAVNIVDSTGIPFEGANPMPTYQATAPTFSSAAALVDSSGVQYSGSNPLSVTISGAPATSASNIVDSSGAAYSGSNPIPVTIATGSNNTVAAANVDSTGVQYSGSNPFPVTMVTSSVASTVVTGPSTVGTVDDGSAPVQVSGIARQANPTAVAAGAVVKSTHDDLGRQVMRPMQVRDLIATAYVQITNGTETTLKSAVAGAYLDLIYIMASNNSDAATTVDIRQVTGGNVIMTLQVPANGVSGVSLPVPIPQMDTGNNWTADMSDITGTTISLSALFSQEV